MLSRIVLFSGSLGPSPRPLLAGCGSTGSGGGNGEARSWRPSIRSPSRRSRSRPDCADVENLTPAGAEPHDLELTPGDVRAVDGAALVLYLGGGFMPALERALQDRDGPRSTCSREPSRRQRRRPRLTGDPACLARSGALRSDGREDRRALGQEAAAGRLVQRLEQLDARLPAGARGTAPAGRS